MPKGNVKQTWQVTGATAITIAGWNIAFVWYVKRKLGLRTMVI